MVKFKKIEFYLIKTFKKIKFQVILLLAMAMARFPDMMVRFPIQLQLPILLRLYQIFMHHLQPIMLFQQLIQLLQMFIQHYHHMVINNIIIIHLVVAIIRFQYHIQHQQHM